MTRLRFVVLVGVFGLVAVLIAAFHPAAQEIDENETPPVSESDLQMYITVYTAMQQDHDLTIDAAIMPYHITLDDFRQIERRIQNQPRLVERVRQALLDNAKAHSVYAESQPTVTPVATPVGSPRRHRARRK